MRDKITSPTNPKYKQVKRLLTSGSYRKKTGLSVVYGKKPVSLLIENAPELIEYILFSEKLAHPPTPLAIPISDSLLRSLPDGTISDQGIVAVIKQRYTDPERLAQTTDKILVLDAIQDPENLGTIARTATAFGVNAIITTPDAANPFHPKAIRASAGYLLMADICRATPREILTTLEKHGFNLLIATPKTGENANQCHIPSKIALILGNEGHGAREIWRQSRKSMLISIKTQIESLNVAAAAAILIFGITGGELLCQDA